MPNEPPRPYRFLAAGALTALAAVGMASAAQGERRDDASVAHPSSLLPAVSAASASVATQVQPSVVYVLAASASDARTRATYDAPFDAPRSLRDQGTRVPPWMPRRRAVSAGSGVVVSTDGYILTNRHVIAGARRVTVRLLDRREFGARVVGEDRATDVALLRVDAPHLTAAPLGDSDSTRVGDMVFAVGNPLGEALSFSVTAGIVSAKGRVLDLPGTSSESIQDFIQTDAAINPGNSGGPLVDARGRVIGINTAIASPTGSYAGYGFAVPINLARTVMRQLMADGRVERAVMGVSIRDAGAEDAAYVGLPDIRGVLVEDVPDSTSPAARAGVRPGDVVIAVDGKPVDRVASLQELVTFRPGGAVVRLDVARKGGERRTLAMALQPAPDATAERAGGDAAGVAPASGTPTPALGVRVVATTNDVARALSLPSDVRGLVVMLVEDASPGAGHLFTPFDGGPDVILSVEGSMTPSIDALQRELRRAGAGAVVTLQLYDAGTRTRRVERVRLSAPPTSP